MCLRVGWSFCHQFGQWAPGALVLDPGVMPGPLGRTPVDARHSPLLHLWAAEVDRSDLQTSYFGEFSVIFGRFRELKAVFHQLDIEFILRHLISNAFRYLTVPQGPKIHESGKINFNWTYDWTLWSLVHCIFTIIFLVGCLIFAFIVFERLSFFCRAFLMIGLSRATYFPMQFDLKSKLKLWSPGPKKWSPGPPA